MTHVGAIFFLALELGLAGGVLSCIDEGDKEAR
jgi:hypothetical protein